MTKFGFMFVDNNDKQTTPADSSKQIVICENLRIGKFANYVVEFYHVATTYVGGITGRCGEIHVYPKKAYRVDKKPYMKKIMTEGQIKKTFGDNFTNF